MRPTPLEATVFALGIHEDTGSLTYPASRSATRTRSPGACATARARRWSPQYLHTPLGEEERALFEALVSGLETHDAGGFELLVAAVAWPEYVDGISNLAPQARRPHRLPRRSSRLVEMDGRVFCVVRAPEWPSSTPSRARRRARGRGPPQAASAVYRGSLDEARAARASPRFRAPCAARSPRSRSCRAPRASYRPTTRSRTRWCSASATARAACSSGEPSSSEGVVTREDLDKAIGHGLAHAPVKAVMSSTVVTCTRRRRSPSCSASSPRPTRAHRGGHGRRGGRRRHAQRRAARARGARAPRRRPSGSTSRSSCAPAPASRRSSRRSRPSVRPFDGVYLVGGAVRDVLMGEPSFDLDIAVEGDGIAFGRALAGALGGRAVPHEKFGTAIVIAGDGERVDVATTRTEFYDRPAALPRVERATIRQDLFRRDFTINAMAVSLQGRGLRPTSSTSSAGSPTSSAGVVRVLHTLSFIDDPTRIFRAIRYENRYGFRDGRPHGRARPRVRRDGPRRRALLGAAAGRAPGAARRGARGRVRPPPGRARRRRGDPSAPGGRRGGSAADRGARTVFAPGTRPRCRPGARGWPCSRARSRRTSCTTGSRA